MASFPFRFAVKAIEYAVLREAHRGLEGWREKEQPVEAGPQSSGSWGRDGHLEWKAVRIKMP